jgi:hypothetical protein
MRATPTMVLVPDAFADVSGFGAVMRRVRGIPPRGAWRRCRTTPSPRRRALPAARAEAVTESVDGCEASFIAQPDVGSRPHPQGRRHRVVACGCL